MNITPIRTEKITANAQTLIAVLDRVLTGIPEQSVLVITSKIISLCEGNVVAIGSIDKQKLIEQESELYIPPEKSKYDISLTVTRNTLIPTAGIDESNGNGYYVLWPRNPEATAREVRDYLAKRFNINDVGVLISDSKTTPLHLGTTGVSLAYAGFSALNNYIDTPDLFGRKLKVTKANVADGLAAAAVLVMGEGNEQTPLVLITDVPFIRFAADAPTKNETDELHIPLADDIYSPLIEHAPWKKGGKK
ncbi:coenzyme F420-0:L-glutamate ligase [Candidatus Gottesmanbacteria bacterium]|nr:coenzyme F420-0:L-glutamate ligase [Candidatus Gottesmanbacteria bacterium]